MQDHPDRRRLLKMAIGKVGAESLPTKSLEGTFKHEGNRHWFLTLKHAEEGFLLRAILRQDKFGNVTAGGPDTIAEGLMKTDEATMREAVAAILNDDDEAKAIVGAYASHVRTTFRLPAPPAPEPRRGFWGWRT